jgi:hypothetical protein
VSQFEFVHPTRLSLTPATFRPLMLDFGSNGSKYKYWQMINRSGWDGTGVGPTLTGRKRCQRTFFAADGQAPAKNALTADSTILGSSAQLLCAALSSVGNRAFGNNCAHSRPAPYGALRSFRP